MKLQLLDDAQTRCLGARLADSLGPAGESPQGGVQLDLRGPLGAGKTTLVRGMLHRLGVVGAVRSPTYTLIEPYTVAGWRVMHYDLYRIGDAEELELLGAREHFASGVLRCVEWPERAEGWLPAPDISLQLTHRNKGRDVMLVAGSPFGHRWLSDLTGRYS